MAVTDNYGWTYPDAHSNPFYTAFESLVTAIDAKVYSLENDIVAWAGGKVVLGYVGNSGQLRLINSGSSKEFRMTAYASAVAMEIIGGGGYYDTFYVCAATSSTDSVFEWCNDGYMIMGGVYVAGTPAPLTPRIITQYDPVGAIGLDLIFGVSIGPGIKTPYYQELLRLSGSKYTDATGVFRAVESRQYLPATSKGIEIGYNNYGGSDKGAIVCYDRGGSAWKNLEIMASILSFYGGNNLGLKVDEYGQIYFGTYAAKGAEAFAGYITIKDIGGNYRKVMVCA